MTFVSNVKAWKDVKDEDQIKRVSREDDPWDSRVEKQLKKKELKRMISYVMLNRSINDQVRMILCILLKSESHQTTET